MLDKERYARALIDQVLAQVQKDIADEDLTAIEELLRYVPFNHLVAYLPEE